MSMEELVEITQELRQEIIDVVSEKEGHLGSSLGVVELTVGLHYVFDTPEDRLVWDVGHQAYGHKMITGRREAFSDLRQWGGISGFPKRSESVYDPFGTGHSSTSLSAVLGMALASQKQGRSRTHIAVIGDASIASGMAFEALNHLGTTQANVLVILNDNTMGIDPSVGALKSYFESVSTTSKGKNLFEQLHIHYRGPIDGHNLAGLIDELQGMKQAKGPRLLHIQTTKGKGLASAEKNQIQFHAPGKFDPLTGKLNKKPLQGKTKYSEVVGQSLLELFQRDQRLMAITPAMPTGSGLGALMRAYPDRCLDVGIAEQHAVTLAAGMATEGLIPVCVIYSTFLQRAYDQLIHDVALQGLSIIFCIDRAGLVGHDGPTHHGLFDMAYLRTIPGLKLLAPRDQIQLRQQLYNVSQKIDGPVAIRYPRGYGGSDPWEVPFEEMDPYRARCLEQGEELAVISVGTMAAQVDEALTLVNSVKPVGHYDLGAIKPLDETMLKQVFEQYKAVITVEEGSLAGGAGSAVSEWALQGAKHTRITCIGVPDRFIPHGDPDRIRKELGLDATGIAAVINRQLKRLEE